ncbi:MAG: DUF4091 domain-containing protein [Clostridia bacterium]|nr:DUF4091 domain-containing protein [Clostridia bacterium]
MLNIKFVSSLEKTFLDQDISDFKAQKKISALRGERLSLQILYAFDKNDRHRSPPFYSPVLSGSLAEYASLRSVKHLPVAKYEGERGERTSIDESLRLSPGLFPDLLEPIAGGSMLPICDRTLESLWVEIEIPEDMPAGEHKLSARFDLIEEMVYRGTGEPETVANTEIIIDVIPAKLPEQKLIHTEWFHADCLASYYNVPVWSERHWEIIENFARVAVKNGINMLLTPVFTLPLDTRVGGERPTTQLVGIKKCGNRYTYNFKLLDRWVDMLDRVGIKYIEVSHLFTQWGATHAPKIMATVDGEYKKIFGWETDAHGEEYKKFLRSFLKAFLNHMKKRGDDKRCFFHISDEPGEKHIENYKKSKKIVDKILEGYTIMDALSRFDYYKKGIIKTPIPVTSSLQEFYDGGVKNLWTYYCGGCMGGYSSRMLARPSASTRSIGMQMYKYDIVGFLHWGYNFYYTRGSIDTVNPFVDTCGDRWVPAGDTMLVYPAISGEALESIRIKVFHDALQDMRAMSLCESLYSKEEVVAAVEEVLGYSMTFANSVTDSAKMLAVREKINAMIKAKV